MSTSVDDTTILEVLRANDDPRLTTTEVADQLPITRGRTRTRLQELVDDDKLKRTKEGNAVVWWLPEREDEIEAESEAEEGEAASEEAEPPDAEPDDAEPAEEEPTGTEAKEDEAEEDEAEEEEAEEPGDEAAEPEPPLADAPGAAEAETPSGETDLVDGPTVEEVGDDIAESMREGADVEGGEAAGPSAGDSDVLVESVESLDRESPGRTPGAETETRPAGERAPRMSREEGLRRLTMVAIVLSAIVILRKLLDRADGPDDR